MKEFYPLFETIIKYPFFFLGLAVEENFVGGDSGVWKCIGKGNVKDIYRCCKWVTYQNV